MAVVTKVIHISDVSGKQIDEQDLARAEITWKGTTYRLSVTKEEYKRVEEYLDDLVEGSEEVEPEDFWAPRSRRAKAASSTGSGLSSEELAQARAWLQEQGEKVADRGRLKAELVEKWEKAGRPHARR